MNKRLGKSSSSSKSKSDRKCSETASTAKSGGVTSSVSVLGSGPASASSLVTVAQAPVAVAGTDGSETIGTVDASEAARRQNLAALSLLSQNQSLNLNLSEAQLSALLSLSPWNLAQNSSSEESPDYNLNLLVLLKRAMTELDSSSPVIWPSWCYGSENGQDDEKTSSTTNNSSGLNLNEKPNKRRRKEAERSSPSESVQSDSEIGIKRSPPPPHHRNYSDFMRSLAAKYNHLPIEPPVPPPATMFNRSQLENNRFLKQSLIDMSSTTALLHLVRSADLKKYHQTPLDLTNNNNNNNTPNNNTPNSPHHTHNGTSSKKDSNCCSSQEVTAILNWSVDDVCRFVSSIDLCKEYAESFRSQSIDGSGLPLITEEHLLGMGMKLGQALKFKSVLRRRLGNCIICQHCPHCHHSNSSNTPNITIPTITNN